MASLTAAGDGGPLLRFGTYFVKTCSGLLPAAAQFDCSWPSISAAQLLKMAKGACHCLLNGFFLLVRSQRPISAKEADVMILLS